VVGEHEEVGRDQDEDLRGHAPHGSVAHRDDGPVRMELEREAHLSARGGQTSYRTRSPFGQGPIERGTLRFDEGIGDDLRRLANGGEGVLAQGETEGKARAGGPANAREPEPDEPAVRDPLSTEILHGPLERAPDSLERRGDFRGPVVVQRDSNSVVRDKVSAPGRSTRSSGRKRSVSSWGLKSSGGRRIARTDYG